jgi:hypothetical protein
MGFVGARGFVAGFVADLADGLAAGLSALVRRGMR